MQPDELRALRKAIGLTQQGLADQLGMSRKAIVEMEGGRAPIERRTALAALYLSDHQEHAVEASTTEREP